MCPGLGDGGNQCGGTPGSSGVSGGPWRTVKDSAGQKEDRTGPPGGGRGYAKAGDG